MSRAERLADRRRDRRHEWRGRVVGLVIGLIVGGTAMAGAAISGSGPWTCAASSTDIHCTLDTTSTTVGTTTTTAATTTTTTKPASTTTTSGTVGDVKPPAGGYFQVLQPGKALPTEASCAAQVHRSTWEPRHDNDTANHTTGSQVSGNNLPLKPFTEFNASWQTTMQRVDGNFTGTTDEIFQWAACKWGWSDELLRAEAVTESNWHQSEIGDLNNSLGSYGILQVKVDYWPQNNPKCKDCAGSSWPDTQYSTAFDVDEFAGIMRGCYEGDEWYGTQSRGDIWGCIGGWYSGSYVANATGSAYVNSTSWGGGCVKCNLANKPWLGWSG